MRRASAWSVGVVLVASLAIALAGCDKKPAATLTPVTLQLSWTHQAQFAGFYAADQQGYYAGEGLKVTFAEGGPKVPVIDRVVDGSAQFGVFGADVLLIGRSQGKDVQAVCAIDRRNPRVYISLRESGITKLEDCVGKTISVNASGRAPFEAMTRSIGISADRYTMVDSASSFDQFYSGQVDVRSVYLTNEVLTIRAAGHQVNIIYPDDYGVHNYGDTVIAGDRLIAEDPDLVRRFVSASLKGWQYVVEHPAEVGAMVAKYKPTADVAVENEKMLASIPLVSTGQDYIGWMRPEIWSGMAATLREQGVLDGAVDPEQAYTMRFVAETYK